MRISNYQRREALTGSLRYAPCYQCLPMSNQLSSSFINLLSIISIESSTYLRKTCELAHYEGIELLVEH